MSTSTTTRDRSDLIAEYLTQRLASQRHEPNLIPKRPEAVVVQASEEQQELWVHASLAGGAPVYNESVMVRYQGALNVSALERAFTYLLQRHEAWRTGFEWKSGVLIQVIKENVSVPLRLIDLRGLPRSQRERRITEVAASAVQPPFNLEHPPLVRLCLIQMDDEDHRLLLVLHHLIFDGFSTSQIFLPELEACYDAFAANREPDLQVLPFQYGDYSLWQQQHASFEERSTRLEYWEKQLAQGVPVLQFPLDRPRPTVRTFEGAMETFFVPAHATEALKNLSRSQGVTFFTTLLSAFCILLYHYTDASDQAIGTVTSTRNQFGTERLLGFFLRTIMLRIVFAPEDSFAKLQSTVRAVIIDAISNEVPFGMLASRFARTRRDGLSPLFQVSFTLEPPPAKLGPSWAYEQMCVDTGTSKADLLMILEEHELGLIGRLTYRKDIFDTSTIVRMKQHWLALLDMLVDDPNQKVADIYAKLATSRTALVAPRRESLWNKMRRWTRTS